MNITLPTDAETERLARKLAEVTRTPLPTVVKQAIEAEAAKAGITAPPRISRDALFARMIAITDGFAGLPILDRRSADEIIGYDKSGVFL